MEVLKNKVIYLLSPQPWGSIHVSKHHYAIELVKRGNKVYFINPPDFTISTFQKREVDNYPGLTEVSYSPFFPWRIRFHLRSLFDFLMRIQVYKLLNFIDEKPDIVWCFDPNIFTNLKWFKAPLKIYHPVDPIIRKDQIKVAQSATILFTVSQKILRAFNEIEIPKYFINHGLGQEFIELAKNNLTNLNRYVPNRPLKVGYVGNLLRKPLDRTLFLKIIEENQDLEFHLWGPYENPKSELDLETIDFINRLKSFKNVIFKGIKNSRDLAFEINEMDLFFLTYLLIDGESDRSNSHKILEYLSTGKTVISVDIETYQNSNLLTMTSEKNDFQILEIFSDVKVNISRYNSFENMVSRINYSMDNSMFSQIEKIEALLSNLLQNN